MSVARNFTMIPNEIIRCGDLSAVAKLVLSYILSLSEEYRHPTQETLKRVTGFGGTRVKEGLQELRARRILDWKSGSKLGAAANEYWLLPRDGWIIVGWRFDKATKGIVPIATAHDPISDQSLIPIATTHNTNSNTNCNTRETLPDLTGEPPEAASREETETRISEAPASASASSRTPEVQRTNLSFDIELYRLRDRIGGISHRLVKREGRITSDKIKKSFQEKFGVESKDQLSYGELISCIQWLEYLDHSLPLPTKAAS